MRCANGKGLFVKPCGRRSAACSVIISILPFLLLLIPALASADGMAFRYGPASTLEPLAVDEQRAIIAHKDGMQRMFIAINLQNPPSLEDPSRAAVWIFPVPGSPDKADVDVTSFIPELRGDDVQQAFKTAMEEVRWIPVVTQPHLFPFAFGPLIAGRSVMGVPAGLAKGAPGVTTHKEIDKWGIHAELITADSVDRLADYLHSKKVGLGEGILKPFAPYLSDKYSLVVAWINSYEEFVSRFPQYKEKRGGKRPALYVEFPADKPFYPMRPTSGYGKKTMTISLYLVGWFNIDMSSWALAEKAAMSPMVRYYSVKKKDFDDHYRTLNYSHGGNTATDRNSASTAELHKTMGKFLSAIPAGDVPFTRVSLRPQLEALNFTQDFSFSPNSRVSVMHFLGSSLWTPVLAVLFLLVIPSYLSGGISGKLVFGQWKPWARIGLWNCLTIVALVIAAWLKRKGSESEIRIAPASGRWEAFAFGSLIFFPLFLLVSAIFQARSLSGRDLILYGLSCGLIVMELLIASWIVMRTTSPWVANGTTPEDKGALLSNGIKESSVRVGLMCMPGVLLAPAIMKLLALTTTSMTWAEIIPLILGSGLITAGWLILLTSFIIVGLIIASWLVRKAKPTWTAMKFSHVDGEQPCREAIVLGILTFIVAVLPVLSIFLRELPTSSLLFRFAWFGLVAAELLIATRIVWKGASASISMEEARFSPAWPMAIAVLLILLPILCLIIILLMTDASAYLLGEGLVYYSGHHVNISDVGLFSALTVTGLILMIGVLNRKRLRRLVKDMTHRTALSTICIVLGVLSYLSVAAQMGAALRWFEIGVSHSLASLALLSATWLVKGLLHSGTTKALRFGVVFSVVFGLLNFAIFLAMAWLGSSGI